MFKTWVTFARMENRHFFLSSSIITKWQYNFRCNELGFQLFLQTCGSLGPPVFGHVLERVICTHSCSPCIQVATDHFNKTKQDWDGQHLSSNGPFVDRIMLLSFAYKDFHLFVFKLVRPTYSKHWPSIIHINYWKDWVSVTRLSLISDGENCEPCDPQIPLEVHYSVSAGGARAQRWMGLLFGFGCMWAKQMGVA